MAIGAISLSKRSCVMLGAIQSPNFKTLESEKDMSMLDWYISIVRSKAGELLPLTDIMVADAFFSKYEFVKEVVAMGFRFVGRLRYNSYLRYLAIPSPSAPRRRGRKKKYGEKVDFSSLDMSVFTSFIYKDSKGIADFEIVLPYEVFADILVALVIILVRYCSGMVVDPAEHDMTVRMCLVEVAHDNIWSINNAHTLHVFPGNLHHCGIIETVAVLGGKIQGDMHDGILNPRIEFTVVLERADNILSVFLAAHAAGVNKPPFVARRSVGLILFLASDVINTAPESSVF